MPRVPTYDSPQVEARALPGVQQSSVASPAMFGAQAEQIGAMGRGLQNAGAVIDELQFKARQEADAVRVDDAINRAKEHVIDLTYGKERGYTGLKGVEALDRASKMPLSDEYAAELDKRTEEIAKGLGNESQKRAFAMRFNDVRTSFYGGLRKYEGDQFQTYTLSTDEGTIKRTRNEIGLFYNDPAKVDEAVTSMNAAVARSGRLLGRSAEWIQAEQLKYTSNAHMLAITAALEKNDVRFADSYLKKYSKQMEADDILRVQGKITKDLNVKVGLGAVETYFQRDIAPKMTQRDDDRAWAILKNQESGNRHFRPDGKVVTSSAGAIGIAQVMPATGPEAAKLAGLPWDKERFVKDPDYNEKLGRAYFNKQVQDFGRLDHAYAAYNAGPGAAQSAIAKAAKAAKSDFADAVDTRGFRNDDFLKYLPAETQNYVRSNMTAYGKGEGRQIARPTLEDGLAMLRRDPVLANNPDALKVATDAMKQRFGEATAAIKQREEEATAAAYEWLMQNGGDYARLPSSLRNAVPPKNQDNLMNFGKRVDQELGDTNAVTLMKMSDPEVLAASTRAQIINLAPEIGVAATNALLKKHEEYGKNRASLSEAKVDRDQFNVFAVEVGLDPTNTKDKNNVKLLTEVRDRVERTIGAEQQLLKRSLTRDQKDEIMRRELDNTVMRAVPFWFDKPSPAISLSKDDQKTAYVVVGKEEIKLSEIPKEFRQSAISSRRAMGFFTTEQDVAALWVNAGKPKAFGRIRAAQ